MLNDYRNVKTINFSELPHSDKRKYFNFLLENEINFTRDENGYYVALVKLLNPAFYGGQENSQFVSSTNALDKNQDNNAKPRSSSQVNRLATKNFNQTLRSKSPLGNNNKNQSDKPKEPFKTTLQTYEEMFNDKYQIFFRTLNPLIGIRGKKLNLYQLKYNIEEIYSIRFIKDTSSLKNQLTNKGQDADIKDPFPTFIVEFVTNKFVKKTIIDQHALDLLISVDYYKNLDREIEIFSKFLNEEYDTDDLIFFLFVRSCIEKEMKIMFIEKAREEIKIQYVEDRDEIDTDLYLNIKVCLKIANTIFGNEEELLLNSFMEKVEKNLIINNQAGKRNKNLIKASTILEITLEDYHHSRKLYGQDSNKDFGHFKSEQDKERVQEKYKDENMFDEFDEETNEYGQKSNEAHKRVSLNKLAAENINKANVNSKNPNSDNKQNLKQDTTQNQSKNQQEKVTRLKSIIFNYIKEKELDIFFDKLMTSYSVTEKENDNIETAMITIKDLVSKKLALLISIIFNQDNQNWFISLKIKEEDSQNRMHYNTLISLMSQIINYHNIQEIPENLIENFGQVLLSTPELNTQINKLVLKHFG